MPHRSPGPRLLGTAAVLGLLLSVLTGLPASASASTPTAVKTRLVLSHSGLCLTAPSRQGASTTQRRCTADSARQLFTLTPTRKGYTVKAAGGCLREEEKTSQRPRRVTVATCPGSTVTLTPVPGVQRGYQAELTSSGRCLEVLGGGTGAGALGYSSRCGDPTRAGHQVFVLDRSASASPTPKAQPTQSTSGRPTTASAALWGQQAPPAGAPLSRAYQTAIADTPKGYQPKSGECSAEVHARYWTYGPDGKVYPTWHPARDPSGCSFGHEHGDDPRTSTLFSALGWPPFGYTNEQLAPSNPASQRNEDHVGHKVAVQNDVLTHPGNDRSRPADMRCSTLIKVHMGSHSPDALTNNLHEVFYNARCTQLAEGTTTEAHLQVLLPIGHPGSVNVTNTCDGSGTTVHEHVGAATPADSPEGHGSSRRVADHDCAASVQSGQGAVDRMNEFWQLELHVRDQGGLARLDLNPYLSVANPARYYDPALPGLIGRTIDVCYAGAQGADCDAVRATSAQQGGARVAFDDARSPFDGAVRHFDANRFYVQNTGPSTLYSDVFGSRFTTTPFPGAIEQYVAGHQHNDFDAQGDIFQPVTDYSPVGSGVHAPN